MQTIRLTGDYVGNHERQRQASAAGCTCVLDFHFNSFDKPSANGGECFYQKGQSRSKELAKAIVEAITSCGLKLRSESLKESVNTRAGFIDYYQCPTVLLEPLFLSNPADAAWIHRPENVQALGKAIAERLRPLLRTQDILGISIGHKGKTSQPKDRGTECLHGDDEADHAEALAAVIESALQAGNG